MSRFRLIAGFLVLQVALHATEAGLKQQVTALFHEQKWSEAQAVLEKAVAADPDNAEAYYLLGESFLYRNEAEQAVPPLEKAVALNPTSSTYYNQLGNAYGLSAQQAGFLSKLGWAKKSKAAYDKAVELDPKNLKARESLVEFCRQAPGFAGGGMDLAYAQAAEIEKIDPARGRMAFASLYVSEKKFTEAFAMYEELLKTRPDDYGALYQIGRLAAATGENLDRGLAALQHCLALKPPADQPGAAPVNWRIGNLLEKKGDRAGAKAAYESALQADPKFSPAAEALKKLGAQ
jgi:tetratricopeptide (TPR) repeat protein